MTATGPRVVVQYAASDASAPPPDFIETCVRRVFPDTDGEIVIRIVDEDESAALNERYRGKRGPTNVLAFPPGEAEDPDDGTALLGDIAICAAVVGREAADQGKPFEAHFAHIVVHACLHLVGYDHMTPDEAAGMEARERVLLAALGIADPYESDA